jgi:imidazolonepropionase
LKLAGATYDEVHAAGGGINASVHATRDASVGELVAAASRRLDRMLAAGTTHVEIKTGCVDRNLFLHLRFSFSF